MTFELRIIPIIVCVAGISGTFGYFLGKGSAYREMGPAMRDYFEILKAQFTSQFKVPPQDPRSEHTFKEM